MSLEALVVRQPVYDSGDSNMTPTAHGVFFDRLYWLPMSQQPIQGCGKNFPFNDSQLAASKLTIKPHSSRAIDSWLSNESESSPVIEGYRDSLRMDSS